MIFRQLREKGYKATKNQIVRLQLNEKKSKESETRLISWCWKRKPTWRKDPITYNSHPWIMFSFNWLAMIWRKAGGVKGGREVGSFETRRPRLRGWRILGVDGQRGWGSWKVDNFHGRHTCVILKGVCVIYYYRV